MTVTRSIGSNCPLKLKEICSVPAHEVVENRTHIEAATIYHQELIKSVNSWEWKPGQADFCWVKQWQYKAMLFAASFTVKSQPFEVDDANSSIAVTRYRMAWSRA
jgi:hypothetical protein